jgi:hypothetical protein
MTIISPITNNLQQIFRGTFNLKYLFLSDGHEVSQVSKPGRVSLEIFISKESNSPVLFSLGRITDNLGDEEREQQHFSSVEQSDGFHFWDVVDVCSERSGHSSFVWG